jgi:hypothetical protein
MRDIRGVNFPLRAPWFHSYVRALQAQGDCSGRVFIQELFLPHFEESVSITRAWLSGRSQRKFRSILKSSCFMSIRFFLNSSN